MSYIMSLRRAIRPVLQFAVSMAIICALVEGGARVLERRFLYIADNPVFFWHMTDPYLGWRNDARSAKRVGLPIDERGYQVYHGENAPLDAPTILCLGDSGTFGIWSDGTFQFDSFAKFLADDLACTVVNTGTVGYTSWHGVRVLKEYKGPLDAVVVRFGWNDHAHGNPMELRNAGSSFATFLNTFAAGRILLFAAQVKQASRQPSITLDEFKQNLRGIARMASARGAATYLVDYPIQLTTDNATEVIFEIHDGIANSIDEINAVHARYIQGAREVATEMKCTFIDTPLRANQFSDVDAVHPNADGAKQIAAYIAENLNYVKR